MDYDFTQEEIDLAMNQVVGSLEQILKKNGHDIGSGQTASDYVHAFWSRIIATSIIQREQGHDLY